MKEVGKNGLVDIRSSYCKYRGCNLNFTFPHKPKGGLNMYRVYKQIRQKQWNTVDYVRLTN